MDNPDITHIRQYAESMIEHLPIGVALYDASNLRLLKANALFHPFFSQFWHPGRAVGHLLTDWQPRSRASDLMAIFRTVAETGIPYHVEEFPSPQPDLSYWNWTLDPVRDHDGRIIQLLQTVIDVTQQVIARQQSETTRSPHLQKSWEGEAELQRQEVHALLSITSHEMRTPITAIQGFADILLQQVGQGEDLGTEQNRYFIQGIVEQCQRLTRLSNEMLDASRLLLHLEHLDLLPILTRVVKSQVLLSTQHHIHLVLEDIDEHERITGYFDEGRIIQIMNNLINNAIKYSPASSEIEIGLRRHGEQSEEVLVWVKDQGIGIPTSELPHIFTRFHRAHPTQRSISGLGIGLYLVNELVIRHGGYVWVESAEGSGSTFYVLLPLIGEKEPITG
ncbi:MAG: PAS domain-containing sensor histidine kinase [Ktedonobacteraceae bacterium]|nr:PAS domain-containing sensor histidine kinase [Chloroflexota bacterium]